LTGPTARSRLHSSLLIHTAVDGHSRYALSSHPHPPHWTIVNWDGGCKYFSGRWGGASLAATGGILDTTPSTIAALHPTIKPQLADGVTSDEASPSASIGRSCASISHRSRGLKACKSRTQPPPPRQENCIGPTRPAELERRVEAQTRQEIMHDDGGGGCCYCCSSRWGWMDCKSQPYTTPHDAVAHTHTPRRRCCSGWVGRKGTGRLKLIFAAGIMLACTFMCMTLLPFLLLLLLFSTTPQLTSSKR
jgi:hypothetical protein